MQFILNLDNQIFKIINSLSGQSDILDLIGVFCARYLIFVIAIIIIVWWLSLAKTKTSANWLGQDKRKWLIFGVVAGSSVVAELINQILGFIKFRDRPFINLDINQLIEHLPEKSFPSDHAAVTFAASLAVYFYNKKLGSLLFILSFLMSLARIYVGVHYPLDIAAGIVLGLTVAFLVYKIFFNKLNKAPKTVEEK